MQRITQVAVAVAVLVSAAWLAGCVKMKQVVTVMPDGSGKIEMTFGLSDQMMQMAQQDGQDPFEEIDPKQMKDSAQGIVAFTEPTREERGNYTYLSFTAYFRDINQVEMEGLGDGEAASYQFTRDGDKATLTVSNGMILSMIADYEPIPKEEQAQVQAMMAGIEFSEHYVLPGLFTDVDGVEAVDNTAKLDIDLKDLLEGTGPIKDLQGQDTLTFEVPAVSVDDATVQAFQAELEAAVVAWQAMLEEAEAAE